jgi:hypothetical protein
MAMKMCSASEVGFECEARAHPRTASVSPPCSMERQSERRLAAIEKRVCHASFHATSALLASSNSATSLWPFFTAKCKGLSSCYLLSLLRTRLGLPLSSTLTFSKFPFLAAS